MKTKTASVRLPKEMFDEIDNICDGVGCSRNEWIKDKLREGIREETNENSQDQEKSSTSIPSIEDIPEETPKPKIEEIPELKNPKIVVTDFNPNDYEIDSEPKPTIKEIPQDNSNKPPVNFVQFNGKLLPFAKRYNI